MTENVEKKPHVIDSNRETLDAIQQKIADQVGNNKNTASDNFDFHELTQDITRSITDQLYRLYQPALLQKYRKKVDAGGNDNVSNDLIVEEIVTKIYDELPKRIAEDITDSIQKRILTELDEQYQAKDGTYSHKRDFLLRKLRHFITPAYFFAGVVLIPMSLVVLVEMYEVFLHFWHLFKWVFVAESWKYDLSSVDQNFVTRLLLNQVVATVLSILDILLLGALVVMVLVGGFENSVGRIGKTHSVPAWFGKLGITELKLKVAGAIVIISSIHLLTFFMLIDVTNKRTADDASLTPELKIAYAGYDKLVGTGTYDYDALKWTAIVHGVFVLSAAVLAWMSTLKKSADNH